ncbi:hypothetical protein COCON_G00021160 [Conger conger]|uniref:Uncharacterized protein n=1 Tax=Conger conger TaxID=82655 RepID=A0A9Q1DWV1_CONCO|nr:hypothetical protein COCON_G00021160 [Conger conger]
MRLVCPALQSDGKVAGLRHVLPVHSPSGQVVTFCNQLPDVHENETCRGFLLDVTVEESQDNRRCTKFYNPLTEGAELQKICSNDTCHCAEGTPTPWGRGAGWSGGPPRLNAGVTWDSPREISSDNEYFNENTHEPLSVDSPEDIWNTACAFLVIFLITLLYSISVTLVMMK